MTLTVAGNAGAQTAELPVIASYVAPAECLTDDGFRRLVATQVEREPEPEQGGRFSVTIRRERGFVGTLETESGVRELHASTCDEVTAALATIIAMAEPKPSEATAPPAPRTLVATRAASVPSGAAARPLPAQRNETSMASPALLGAGVVMLAVGAAAIPVGALHMSTASAATEACPTAGSCQPRSDVIGIATVGGGAGLAVGGLVMSVLGLQRKHVSVAGGPTGSTGATVRVAF